MNAPAAWLLDAGNSRIKCACLRADGTRDAVSAYAHDDPAAVRALLDRLRGGLPAEAWLASVAPAAATAFLEVALAEAGLRLHRVRTEAQRGRLRIAYADPSNLGVDRFLGLLAASERGDGACLLVSAGTALTVDLLDADGQHLGGLIAPMPAMMRSALAGIAQLAVGDGRRHDFATDTADAIASGCEGAALGLVERSLRLATVRLGGEPTVLLTGGGADMLKDLAAARVVIEPTLVLDGLSMLARGASE